MVIKMVITLSGVTGVGKSYFKNGIQNILGIKAQTIVTTREKRQGEKDGVDKKFVDNEEFEKLKKQKDILLTFELLGYKYGFPRIEMESEENSIVELHYATIYQLKREIKHTFSIYIIPENLEIAKQKLKERKLSQDIEQKRLTEIAEHIKNFNSNADLRNQFDYIFYNDYTEKSVEKLVNVIKNKLLESKNINRE